MVKRKHNETDAEFATRKRRSHKIWRDNVVRRTVDTCAVEMKEESAYTDTENNMIRAVYAKREVLREGTFACIDRRLLAVVPRLATDRLTLNSSGKFMLQGNSKSRKNQVNPALVDTIFELLSDDDKLMAEELGFISDGKYGIVGEHRSGNKLNCSEANYSYAVMQKTNTKFKDKRKTGAQTENKTSICPGVKWDKNTNKWNVQTSSPDSKKVKCGGHYYNEFEARDRAMELYDEGYADHPVYRTAMHFYKDGKLDPYLKTYDTFSDIAKMMRPELF